MKESLSVADLYVIASALRQERAQRVWNAMRNGHRARGIDQLRRLETLFVRLAEERKKA